MDEQNKGVCGMDCKCTHHSVVPLCIILVAAAFLLQEVSVISTHTLGIIWPTLVIIGAAASMFENKCHCC